MKFYLLLYFPMTLLVLGRLNTNAVIKKLFLLYNQILKYFFERFLKTFRLY